MNAIINLWVKRIREMNPDELGRGAELTDILHLDLEQARLLQAFLSEHIETAHNIGGIDVAMDVRVTA